MIKRELALSLVAAFAMLALGLVAVLAAAPATGLTVDEQTNDVSVVSVSLDMMTLVPGKEAGTIEVLQLLRVMNSSDQTFIGTAPASATPPVAVVRVPVPQGAFDVAPIDDLNRQGLAETQEGIASTAPLPPGESTISYLYRVRAPRTGWQLRREIFYPTAKADLLIGPGLALKTGPAFTFAETKELGGKTYRRYRGEMFLPGAVLGADIGYDDEAGAGLWWGLAGIAAALIAVAATAATIRRRKIPKKRPEAGTVAREKASMIERIALLDLEHEAGAISDEDYLDQREDMKSKLT